MPYIPQSRREELIPEVLALTQKISHPGELNYVITMLLRGYMVAPSTPAGYCGQNEIMGVLACVSEEWYRRVTAELENEKCYTNGDVFK